MEPTPTSQTNEPEVEFNFKYEKDEYNKVMAVWVQNKWPVKYLLRDHLGAKLLTDNNIFEWIKFYKHEYKWEDEEGFIILHKKTKNTPSVFSPWSEIYPYVSIKKARSGAFLFDNASYTEDGFKIETSFQYSADEFKSQLNKWIAEKWPVQYLLRDHLGAKVLFDNQVFPLIEFYGHSYKWSETDGLLLMCQKSPNAEIEWVAFQEILDDIPLQQTPQGWHLFDGWIYGQNGLVKDHLWQWPELLPSYKFPADRKPNHCYVDIVVFNWEHDGLPGLGFIGRNPHGHTSIEFGDDLGNFYSVGMYMDPRSPIDPKKEPGATIRACLMSPDPYMPSKGEKTVHRYDLGSGPDGRNNVQKLKSYIEEIQSYSKNTETGIVKTCPRKYHVFKYNCGDFQEEVEQFTIQQLKGKLIKLDDTAVLAPLRHRIQHSTTWKDFLSALWNRFLLTIVDLLLFLVISIPWINKKLGAEKQDDFSDFEPTSSSTGDFSKDGIAKFYINNFRQIAASLRPKSIKFPRKIRIEQLYSRRLKNYSALLKS